LVEKRSPAQPASQRQHRGSMIALKNPLQI
jgi:hypothetical protein